MRGFLIVVVLSLLFSGGCSSQQEREDALESARQAYSIGHFSEAERIYQHYLQAQPEGGQRWEAWNRLVEISINVMGDYEKAAGLLDSMYLEYGEDAQRAWDLLSRLAEVYEVMHRQGDAVKTWRKTLDLPGLTAEQRGQVYIRMAKILRQQNEFVQAEKVLEACVGEVELSEVKAGCLYEYAQTLEYMARRAQARTLENEVNDLDVPAVQERIKSVLNRIRNLEGVDMERKAMATFLLADLLESQGKRDQARELFASIRETYPNPKVIEARLANLK